MPLHYSTGNRPPAVGFAIPTSLARRPAALKVAAIGFVIGVFLYVAVTSRHSFTAPEDITFGRLRPPPPPPPSHRPPPEGEWGLSQGGYPGGGYSESFMDGPAEGGKVDDAGKRGLFAPGARLPEAGKFGENKNLVDEKEESYYGTLYSWTYGLDLNGELMISTLMQVHGSWIILQSPRSYLPIRIIPLLSYALIIPTSVQNGTVFTSVDLHFSHLIRSTFSLKLPNSIGPIHVAYPLRYLSLIQASTHYMLGQITTAVLHGGKTSRFPFTKPKFLERL